ncbi:hypothetical protein BJ928_102478 [Rhizobium sp. WW_1]|jgi:hypothetical protein|nr:hypothetical protein BJ928_102478 [Rhizobium sp. WW_1]
MAIIYLADIAPSDYEAIWRLIPNELPESCESLAGLWRFAEEKVDLDWSASAHSFNEDSANTHSFAATLTSLREE